MFTLTVALIATVNADGGTAAAGIGAGGAIAAALIALIGRRRADGVLGNDFETVQFVIDEANRGICSEATRHFKQDHMWEFAMSLVRRGENMEELESLAAAMGSWCKGEATEGRRRLGGEPSLEDQFSDFIDSLHLDSVFDDAEDSAFEKVLRRRSNGDIPPHMYQQCAGYGVALTKLIEAGVEEGAIMFGASSNGSKDEKARGCGSVVNTVNAAIKSGEIEGLSVVEEKPGSEIIVVDSLLASEFGSLVTAVTLASGALVHKLMNLCEYYQ